GEERVRQPQVLHPLWVPGGLQEQRPPEDAQQRPRGDLPGLQGGGGGRLAHAAPLRMTSAAYARATTTAVPAAHAAECLACEPRAAMAAATLPMAGYAHASPRPSWGGSRLET